MFLSALRRRRLALLMVEQAALAVALAMGVFALLLILGTQILNWYWPVGTLAAALLVGALRLRGRIPAPYGLLRAADGRLHLHDAISTAYHFAGTAALDPASAQVRAAQRRDAETLALTADPAAAVPWSTPRPVYAAIGATVVALSLFGLRYGVLQSLDLRAPMAPVLAQFFQPSEEMVEAWNRPPKPEPEIPPETLPPTVPDQSQDPAERVDDALLTPEETAALAEGQASDADRHPGEADARNADSAAKGTPPVDAEAGQQASSKPEDAGDRDNSKSKPPSFDQDSDLLRKMQDAFANLMNKLNVPPRAGERQRAALSRAEAAQSERQRQAPGQESGEERKGEGGPPTNQSAQQAAGQSRESGAQEGQQQQTQAGEASQKSANRGAGQGEGDKQLRQAAQLEAMGRLEEIVGNRAENLKGEIMVEVSSGPQQLTTSYSETDAAHRAAGTEIHRDQVPLSLQPYIQRYFEEVRKGEQPTAR